MYVASKREADDAVLYQPLYWFQLPTMMRIMIMSIVPNVCL